MAQTEIVICSPVRTAIGTYGGALKDTPAPELGAAVVRETLRRSGLAADAIDAVVLGQVIQAGARMNPARQASIGGGLPVQVPALTVNRVCGSGAQAIATAALEVAAGHAGAAIAGGMENMDQAPYLVPGGRWGNRMGDALMLDSMLRDGLNDAFSGQHSGWHTEDLVSQYGVTREDQDRWAARSQQRFSAAQAAGKFAEEIVAIELAGRKGAVRFDKDEANRPDTTVETLAKLKPAFRKDGTITAGNARGLNSGAAAVIVTERAFAERHGLQPWARLVAQGVAAVEPGRECRRAWMGSRAGLARRSGPWTRPGAPYAQARGQAAVPAACPRARPAARTCVAWPPSAAHARAAAGLWRHPLGGPRVIHAHARQFRLPLRDAHALHGLRDLGLHHEVDDALAELAVGRVRRGRQRVGDLGPGLDRTRARGPGCRPGLVLAPLLADSCSGTGLAPPAAQAAPGDASRGLRRGFGLDAPVAQLLGEGLAPAVQVFLAGI